MGEISAIDVLVAISALATAIFTGATAYLAWRQRRGDIIHEWKLDFYQLEVGKPFTTNIKFTIRNNQPHGIEVERIDFSGIPIESVKIDHGPASLDLPNSAVWIAQHVPPQGSYMALVRLTLDWSRMQPSFAAWRHRYIIGTVTVASSIDTRRKRRLKATMLMPAAAIRESIAAARTKPSE